MAEKLREPVFELHASTEVSAALAGQAAVLVADRKALDLLAERVGVTVPPNFKMLLAESGEKLTDDDRKLGATVFWLHEAGPLDDDMLTRLIGGWLRSLAEDNATRKAENGPFWKGVAVGAGCIAVAAATHQPAVLWTLAAPLIGTASALINVSTADNGPPPIDITDLAPPVAVMPLEDGPVLQPAFAA